MYGIEITRTTTDHPNNKDSAGDSYVDYRSNPVFTEELATELAGLLNYTLETNIGSMTDYSAEAYEEPLPKEANCPSCGEPVHSESEHLIGGC